MIYKKRQHYFTLFRLQNIQSVIKIKSKRQLYIKNKQKYSTLVGMFQIVLTYQAIYHIIPINTLRKKEVSQLIRFEHVSRVFHNDGREFAAVNDVSLEIEKGEIFGIIGFSGAGKSTLVRCINLLERPTSGKVFIGDEELTAMSPAELRQHRKKIGMIFQQFNLFASRTVYDNVAFPLKGSNLTKEQNVQIEIKEMGAADIPSVLPDVTAAVVNGNYALDYGIDPSTAIFEEKDYDDDSYFCLMAVRSSDADDAVYKRIVELFQSETTKQIFQDEFNGYFVPAWEVQK